MNPTEKERDEVLRRKLQRELGCNPEDIEIQMYDETTYLNQRDAAIQKVQPQMQEVHDLMQTTANLVTQQAPKVDTIAENITMSLANVEKAEKAIEKKDEQQRKAMCCSIV